MRHDEKSNIHVSTRKGDRVEQKFYLKGKWSGTFQK